MNFFNRQPRPKPTEPYRSTREIISTFQPPDPVRCRCGYDIRLVTANCPECGRATFFARLEHLSRHTGYSTDTIAFVYDAYKRQSQSSAHITPAEFCRRVLAFSIEQAGTPKHARDLLIDMGLKSSEHIGAIVFAFVSVSILSASEEDRPEAFDHLFTLDNGFPSKLV
ncbi:MAG TPA: hypothetical protein VM008_05325 [Phycisphaerae bacterium]|nr:hypothetical protein [Phycisphaerae bacterium]